MKEVLVHGIYANKVAYCVCGCSFKYDEEDVVKLDTTAKSKK